MGDAVVGRIPFMPEMWLVPATLADFECVHGLIEGCAECAAARAAEPTEPEDDKWWLQGRPEASEQDRKEAALNGRETKWTREVVVAAVREVGALKGGTPSHADMKEAGYSSASASTTLERLGMTWPEVVTEAGFQPLGRGERRAEHVNGNGNGNGNGHGDEREPLAGVTEPLDLEGMATRLLAGSIELMDEARALRVRADELEARSREYSAVADTIGSLAPAKVLEVVESSG